MDLTFKPPLTIARFTRNGFAYRIQVELESYDSEPRAGEISAVVLKVLKDHSVIDEIFFAFNVDLEGVPFTTSDAPGPQTIPSACAKVDWELTRDLFTPSGVDSDVLSSHGSQDK